MITITHTLQQLFGVNDKSIENAYFEDHRHYHNFSHIMNMLLYINTNYKEKMDEHLFKLLTIAVIFHDVVYVVGSKTNEEDSYELCREFCIRTEKFVEDLPILKEMIMATKNHTFTEKKPIHIEAILKADLDGFAQRVDIVWKNTMDLFKEFQCYDWKEFQKGQIEFLKNIKPRIELGFVGTNAIKNIDSVIEMLKCWQPKIAIYPGSFNPFHEGHFNILNKAEEIFDKVIIAKGVNPEKSKDYTPLPTIIKDRQIVYYDGLLTDLISSFEYPVTVIRGLRNGTDLSYELNQYRYLKDLDKNIKVVSLFCDAQYEHISSSAIRNLKKYGIEKYDL